MAFLTDKINNSFSIHAHADMAEDKVFKSLNRYAGGKRVLVTVKDGIKTWTLAETGAELFTLDPTRVTL